MKELNHPPAAACLLESMRSLGYSVGTALADIVDNSISAEATAIEILFSPLGVPYVAILDNGAGMLPTELDEAMRHGSSNPQEVRDPLDLGRFGLGLKTASLSQCRRLTVLTKRDGIVSGRCWDMDLVNERNSWVLLSFEAEDMAAIPHFEALIARKKGTLVLWQGLDRLLAGDLDPSFALGEKINDARQHLALVFHRFLEGETGLRHIRISINNIAIDPASPFLESNSLTQRMPEDSFKIEGQVIRVKPYILPHPARMGGLERNSLGGQEGIRSLQGFYVYRNARLIIWGTWFRLARKDELSRLARVKVDIPNALDHLWVLDIRKSIASPPEIVRSQLARTVERIREQSKDTHVLRGRKERCHEIEHGWNRVYHGGTVRYDVNRDHPAIKSYRESLSEADSARFEAVLRIVESAFPVESLYVDMASEERILKLDDEAGRLRSIIEGLLSGLEPDNPLRNGLLATLHLSEPFSYYPELSRKLVEEFCHD